MCQALHTARVRRCDTPGLGLGLDRGIYAHVFALGKSQLVKAERQHSPSALALTKLSTPVQTVGCPKAC